MVPILINKDMFEPSYNDLKFRSKTAITFVQILYFLNLWMCYLVCVCKHTYNNIIILLYIFIFLLYIVFCIFIYYIFIYFYLIFIYY